MKIKKLISVFERLLPIYKEAFEGDWSWDKLCKNRLNCGICMASDYELLSVFTTYDGYYYNLTRGSVLFRYPDSGKDLKSRIDFMESEIKDLKRLIKKGYTHV